MKRYPTSFIFFTLALAVIFFPIPASRAFEPQQPKAAAEPKAAAQDDEDPEYEKEYEVYEKATQEPDIQKRAAMLADFVKEHPKSKLMPHVEGAYKTILFDLSNGKKYDLLEPLAEKWLQIHPNDAQTLAYIATAAGELGHD